MHELSLACSLIEEAEKILDTEDARRTSVITVGIGVLSGVETDAFAFAFPLAAKGTRLETARLRIEKIPVQVMCRACGQHSNPVFPQYSCVHCDSDRVDLQHGREFMIQSMEIETGD